jgi:pimeloyl-ACP methyl ester carboxylesterase
LSALVFVHGLSGSGRWWRPVLPFFRDRDVRVVDLPRFGALQGFVPHDAAAWLGDWLDDEGLAGADLAGHSLGGLIAAELAVQRPGTVRRLVLVAPAGVPTGRGLAGHVLPLLATMRDAPPALVAHALRDGLRAGPESLLRGGLYAIRHDIRDDLAAVRIPTLLVWGERDPLVPRHLAEEWTRALPDVRLVALPQAGHVPMFDAPAALADELRKFLDGDEPLDERGHAARSGVVGRVRRARDDGELPAG